ncbi:hypothetical protein LOK49_LG09G01353 [Camellia lanceoleosa]|uniref:Uncharacterized protein n=1 Tax=Camellia lanceoleosa TaxID=1840588 RepID=A0ACC0GES6_9ERIC|nr:hypothetical protein LOK49_LG09G01353 [Camellia lanceoleosa]
MTRKYFIQSAMKSSRSSSLNSTPFSSSSSIPASPHWSVRAWFVVLRISTSFSMMLRSRTCHMGLSSPRPWSRSRWRSRRQRSKFMVAKAEQERRAAIIRAEGESEVAKLISDATAALGMGLIELRKIEASR